MLVPNQFIVREIILEIKKFIFNNPIETTGFFNGKSGASLFFFYDFLYSGDEKSFLVGSNYLENEMSFLNNSQNRNKSNDFQWFLWTLFHLKKKSIVELDENKINSYQYLLQDQFKTNSSERNYDLLHGNIGLGLVLENFMSRKAITDQYVTFFLQTCKTEGNIYKWEYKDSVRKSISYNIGLAHGMPSIILYLIKLANFQTDNNDIICRLIEGGVNYFIEIMQNASLIGSFFPNFVTPNSKSTEYSRLAWCYGDLGVGLSILKSGILLKNKHYIEIGHRVLINCAQRRDPASNFIKDFSICHGSSGLIIFFDEIFLMTNDIIFKEAADYWFAFTINEIIKCGNIEKVYAWKHEIDGGPYLSKGFLLGLSGIGLVLLSRLDGRLNNWEECLLLNDKTL